MKRIVIPRGKYIYSLSESVIHDPDSGTAIVYGITIGGKGVNAAVEDISDDFNYVCSLFDLIVEEELYPEHLIDVVEDYLARYSPQNVPIKQSDGLPLVI